MPAPSPERASVARSLLKRATRALVAAVGTNVAVAEVLRVSHQLVAVWSEDEGKVIGWEHALNHALPPRARAAFFAELVGPKVIVISAEEWIADTSRHADLRLAATVTRSSSAAVAELLDAVADGHITRSEGVRIKASVDMLLEVLFAIRERADTAIREGVIGEHTGAEPRKAA